MADKEIPSLNCVEHPKLLINYFCPEHDAVFCENCKTEIHETCNDVKTIRDACKKDANNQLMSELVERFSEAKEVLSLTTDKLEDNIAVLSRQYSNVKENIQNARKSITEYLDSLESELTHLVHDRCIKSAEDQLVEMERRKYTLDQWDDELQVAIHCENEETLFSMLKILLNLQGDMESYLSDLQNVVTVKNVRWTPIRTDRSSVATFIGTLSLTETSTSLKLLESPRSARPNIVRESSVASHLSVGTVNIVQESQTSQGFNGISSRTEGGWNEVSSKVQDKKVEIAENEKDSDATNTKMETVSKKVAVLNGLVDATTNNGPRTEEEVDLTSEQGNVKAENDRISPSVTEEQSRHVNSAEAHLNEDNTARSQQDFTLTCSTPKRTDVSVPKLNFEATGLDKRSGTEVHKGLFITKFDFLFLDKQNKHIFLCDKEGTVKHKIDLVHNPQDVSMLDKERVVVTLGHVGLQLVNIKTCKKDKYHDVGGFCSAIVSYKGHVIVSVDNKLRLLDTFGYTLRRIQHDGCAHFVTTDKNGRIYYSDSLNHMVYCIAWYGIPVFIYSSQELRYPMGIVAEPSGSVYITGFESNNVIKLWPNGRFHSVFLSEKDEIYEPSNLDYNQDTGEILVIRDSNQNVEIYDTNNSPREQT